ncbi:MAG: hypothetical protein A2516_10130 [Alphaproteobacteria bacterium RIFOXYD12_FULL_60_8]|nr:MAG: hypothetical protein A2516_10130 [Alphaproteobacteria bacterium RIFOXYD12_FULL_60_8]
MGWGLNLLAVSGNMRIYLNEYNVMMGRTTYLPLATGLLRAFAQTDPRLKGRCTFKPFLFHIDEAETILAKYDEAPDVVGFSLAMWNEQLSLIVAKAIKTRYPNCLIIFGGAQAPHQPEEYFVAHPFVDLVVKGEGEEAFADILAAKLEGTPFDTIPGVVWRDPKTGACRQTESKRPFDRELDQYPSPYLTGLYDELMSTHSDMGFQAIVETNRGCPFQCAFCYWGKGGLSRKYRYHTMERVQGEIEWCGKKGIRYVFNADSNFGMHKRDMEIAQFIVATKKKYGFPEKFRTCYGKNTDEKIFAIGKLFHAHGLEKGITLSRQSNEPLVQKNIRRENIHLETYRQLQTQFNEEKIPVYSEMILGLPGETFESWTRGVAELLVSGLKNQLFIYILQVYPNTELGDPAYQKEFGLVLMDLNLNEIHGSVRPKGWTHEKETIVIGSAAMTTPEWGEALVFSWMTMLLHSLKAGFYLLFYLSDRLKVNYRDFLLYLSQGAFPADQGALLRAELAFFHDKLAALLRGEGRGCSMPEAGELYWDVEEAALLHLCRDFETFYDQMLEITLSYLKERGIDHDPDEVEEVVTYQRLKIPTPSTPLLLQWTFRRNIPEYFEAMFKEERIPLHGEKAQRMEVSQEEFEDDLKAFARATILFGRKSDVLIRPSEWADA